jgi:hypothetical protein
VAAEGQDKVKAVFGFAICQGIFILVQMMWIVDAES